MAAVARAVCLAAIATAALAPSAQAIIKPVEVCPSGLAVNESSACTAVNVSQYTVYVEEYPSGYLSFFFNDKDSLECSGDYFFPFIGAELMWSRTARAGFYFFLLGWFFLGVAIISDHFMAAIEVITAKERVIVVENAEGDAEERKVLVWDETVANLTLMALGSSAPEILLSIIETVGALDKEPEDGLGPSTIVGSAAFNLLIISAVCVAALKDGEKRTIERYGVFMITATFSVFAYVWMYIVLNDEVVTIPEAIITFALFPLLVGLSYAQAKNWFGLCGASGERRVRPEGHVVAVDGENHKHVSDRRESANSHRQVLTVEAQHKAHLANMLHQLPTDLDDEDLAKMAAQGILQKNKVSAMRYRIDARRKLAGGGGVLQNKLNFIKKHTIKSFSPADLKDQRSAGHSTPAGNQQQGLPRVTFPAYAFSVNESSGKIDIPVVRSGTNVALGKTSTVYYETRSGSARAGEDFEEAKGMLVFEPGVTELFITVKIIDDNEYEPDENFFIVLSVKGSDHNADLNEADYSTAEVTIIDDDKPGTFSFREGGMVVRESDQMAKCTIQRTAGVDGRVKILYRTRDATAKKDVDYFESSGTIIFEDGVRELSFNVALIDDKSYDKDLTFAVEFDIVGFPDCGALYGEHRILSVTVTSDERYRDTVDRIADLMKIHLENGSVGSGSWSEQLVEALTVQGEDGTEPGLGDCIMHILTFGWKVLFALVPPTSIYGGYLSFAVSLLFIGVITMAVGDIAKIFGCLVGVPNSLTAITFVALGTSLPDTFASKTAAENDSTADNSIGNVTGSNSVNVFLGLGLPWMIGALYKGSQGEEYRVKAGSLSFSVFVFCCVAVVYFIVMYARRRIGWGELGGPSGPKWFSVGLFIVLWATYVGLSGYKALSS